MSETTRFQLPQISASQAGKDITHNEALVLIDALLHLQVENQTETSSPVSAVAGSCYIVNGQGGSWSTYTSGNIATYVSGAGWREIAPKYGTRAYDKSLNSDYMFTTSWIMDRHILERTEVSTTTFTANAGHSYLGVTIVSGASCQIALVSGVENHRLTIKDEVNNASARTISVSAAAGQTIDGVSTNVINTNGGLLDILFIGGGWRIMNKV